MKRTIFPLFSPLLLFFFLVTTVLIVVNAKAELESNVDNTSILITHKTSEINSTSDSLKHVRISEEEEEEEEEEGEEENEDEEDDGDNNRDEEENEEREDKDASGEGQEKEEETEEYEGEERNEYEDELKALAESHEAMSKDETKDEIRDEIIHSNTNNSSAAKNFESHENVLENKSDEDVAFNEAITDELPKKHEDKEVADLIKYKKEKGLRQIEEEEDIRKKKKKRVPTVKKELSTQKEIILPGNETQVPKSLVPSEETFNDLNEETDPVKRGDSGRNERAKDKRTSPIKDFDRNDIHVNISDDIQELFNKWLENLVKNVTKVLRTVSKNKEKLHESKDQEEKIGKFLLKLDADLPGLLERYYKKQNLILDESAYMHYLKNMQNTEKRNDDELLTTFDTVTEVSQDDSQKERKKAKKKKKKKKKKMKKKKKLQDRQSTTTTTTTTTETTITPPSTITSQPTMTSIQWQQLSDKLSGPPWQENVRPESNDIAKIRYSAGSKPKTINPSSSIRRFMDQHGGEPSNINELNTDRQSLLLQKGHKLSDKTNFFPFEKMNPNRNGFDTQVDHLGDYEKPERVLQSFRFGPIILPPRDFSHDKDQEDYQDDDGRWEEEFAHMRDNKPPNQNFAMSRSWPDISSKYNNLPWKEDEWDRRDERTMPSHLPNEWPWRQPQYNNNYWSARGRTWPSIRNTVWTPLNNDDEENSESNFGSDNRIDRNWRWRESQERRQRQQEQEQEEDDEGRFPYPWELEGSNVWSGSQPFQVKPPWSQTESSQILKTRENVERKMITNPWDDTKIRPYETPKSTTKMAKQYGKSQVSLPKISMTTWNSLTSDPATWPYKSSDTKPWPKDENGKSYNPNADLVKKLGLDKNDAKTYEIPNDQWNVLQTNQRNASSKQENESITKYNLPKDILDYGNYNVKSKNMIDWTKPRTEDNRRFESLIDDVYSWYRGNKQKPVWSTKYALTSNLPKIQSVDAWVMPADKSTSMSHRFEHQNVPPINENPTKTTIQRWFEPNGSSNMVPNNEQHINGVESWSSRPKNVNPWNKEYDLLQDESNPSDRWSSKSNKVFYWPSKFENDYSNKENYVLRDRKSNFDKGQPENVDLGVTNHKIPIESSKGNETNIKADNSKKTLPIYKSNNWNNTYERSNTWPSKWKQFSYHRVTTLPISKPGMASNFSSNLSKNAFVAVSAIASQKYTISKNDDNVDESLNNRNNLLEKQLEDLRQQNLWNLKANAIEESIRSPTPAERLMIVSTIEPTIKIITNSTSMVVHRPEEEEELPKYANK